MAPSLEELLIGHRMDLEDFLRREGSGLLRFESVLDLVQGVHLHALQASERFEYRGEGEFLAWLRTLAAQHVADRNRYWKAGKRNAGKLLRMTDGNRSAATGSGGIQVSASQTGASTYASRKEMLLLAVKAIELLLPRDQELLRSYIEDVPIDAMAGKLGISYDAAERARLRAVERFRKIFTLLPRGGG